MELEGENIFFRDFYKWFLKQYLSGFGELVLRN